jgi:peptide deformylase
MKPYKILKDSELATTPAQEVKDISLEVREICVRMCITMKLAGGVGLAAPQVGVNKRITVINSSTFSDAHFCTFMINPVILSTSGEQAIEEKCLSFGNKVVTVKRPRIVKVKYQNTQGDELTHEFVGLAAQVIQHELDHLDGVTFIEKGRGYKL